MVELISPISMPSVSLKPAEWQVGGMLQTLGLPMTDLTVWGIETTLQIQQVPEEAKPTTRPMAGSAMD